ncbi:unnamed protein product, partial [Brassica napus]
MEGQWRPLCSSSVHFFCFSSNKYRFLLCKNHLTFSLILFGIRDFPITHGRSVVKLFLLAGNAIRHWRDNVSYILRDMIVSFFTSMLGSKNRDPMLSLSLSLVGLLSSA